MLIGLAGYAQSGKDTFANLLVERHGFVRVAFADALRECLYTLDPMVTVEGLRLQDLVDDFGWDKVKVDVPEVRELLQRFGTEVGRKLIDDDLWVTLAMRRTLSHSRVVITDVRFPNEAEAIVDAGGIVVRVTRPGTGPVNGHHSETAMDGWKYHSVVVNDASIEDLHHEARRLVALLTVGAHV